MNRGSIPNSRGEKNVRTLAALPTGGSAFCGALEEGMGDVFVSVTQTNKQTNKQVFSSNQERRRLQKERNSWKHQEEERQHL